MTDQDQPATDQHRTEPALDRGHRHAAAMWAGATSFCRLPYAGDLAGVDLAIVGLPVDAFVSNRPGTRLGPRAIRAASAMLAWERAWPSEFDPFETMRVADWGDVSFDYGQPAGIPGEIEAALRAIHAAGPATLCLGGDHFVAYPSLCAHAARHGAPLSLIQFDAHTDTWGAEGREQHRLDHGTMFRRAAEEGLIDPASSIQIGIRTTNDTPMGFTIRDAGWVHENGPDAVVAEIRRVVGDRPAYLSFDIDCLDPAYAPGTGTPVCGGLSSWTAKECLRRLGLAGGTRIVGMDLVEVSPPFDHAEVTALAGATLALEMICLYARLTGRAGAGA
ncbi:agmatinase [Paralimibaculum aggregatum]|uniref:Agmatinase n=1 Tax=Paralimibaculum aggregatum TaxID=3036245 RepID=A0ABQ6LJQ7_9RHOB|nr:agmatinase [Limibaculum sp. NKW23]GMG83493.1 agmatinase [Limibaculum sp. NKW23]